MRISDWSSDVCSSDLFALLIFEADTAFDHFIEAQRVFRLETIHHLRLKSRIDLAVTQNLNQFFGDAVMQEAVFFEAFVAGAEKLNAALVALAALAVRYDGDCAHQAQQRAFYELVALVRALERGFGDAVNDRLADPLPGVGNQQIVDSASGGGAGGKLDNIDQLAGLDDYPVNGRSENGKAECREGDGQSVGE